MTTCISPPELDAMQLAEFVAGEADRITTDHLAMCPYCRGKAAQMALIHQSLARPLFRVHCPSPDELREYHFGFLLNVQMEEITQHLQICARCTRELVRLDEFLVDADVPVALFDPLGELHQRVKTILAQLLPRPIPGTPMSAMAGLRGTSANVQSLYQAGELQIALQSDRDPRQAEGRILIGAIWGGNLDNWTARLWQDKQLIASIPVDELGSFRFENVEPGTYEIILAGLELKIHITPVAIV